MPETRDKHFGHHQEKVSFVFSFDQKVILEISLCEVAGFCVRCVLLNGFDAVVSARFTLVHLAAADDLAISRFEIEEKVSFCGRLPLVAGIVSGILFDGRDAVLGGGFSLVHFASQDLLAIAGLQAEEVFIVIRFCKFKFACHKFSLVQ